MSSRSYHFPRPNLTRGSIHSISTLPLTCNRMHAPSHNATTSACEVISLSLSFSPLSLFRHFGSASLFRERQILSFPLSPARFTVQRILYSLHFTCISSLFLTTRFSLSLSLSLRPLHLRRTRACVYVRSQPSTHAPHMKRSALHSISLGCAPTAPSHSSIVRYTRQQNHCSFSFSLFCLSPSLRSRVCSVPASSFISLVHSTDSGLSASPSFSPFLFLSFAFLRSLARSSLLCQTQRSEHERGASFISVTRSLCVAHPPQ